MKKTFGFLLFMFCLNLRCAQKVQFQTLLKDNISIRALQIYDGKVWYSGTDSKFGYVSLKDSADKKQMRLADEKLEFRTLAQSKDYFYTINILSPAYIFRIDKKTLQSKIIETDTTKTVFFDAFIFDKYDRGLAISDPGKNGGWIGKIFGGKPADPRMKNDFPTYFPGEAHFAASNTNIATKDGKVWIATGE